MRSISSLLLLSVCIVSSSVQAMAPLKRLVLRASTRQISTSKKLDPIHSPGICDKSPTSTHSTLGVTGTDMHEELFDLHAIRQARAQQEEDQRKKREIEQLAKALKKKQIEDDARQSPPSWWLD